MHDARARRMAGRKVKAAARRAQLVDYADAEPSAFASMLGGLIQANVEGKPDRRRDFDELKSRVGIWVTDIDEGVTLEFKGGSLTVHNGLTARRDLTIRADADTVMSLSNLRIGLFKLPVYYDAVGRNVAMKMLTGRLRVEGLVGNLATLNMVTRIFSVA